MLSNFFDSVSRIRTLHRGTAGALFDGFAQTLLRAGYAQITTRGHIRAAEHFVAWAGRKGLQGANLDERALERFDRHLPRCRCQGFGHHNRSLFCGARLFLQHLREAGVVIFDEAANRLPDPPLMVAFCRWMRESRSSYEATLKNYGRHIRKLLQRLGEEPERFDASGLRRFVMEGKQTCGWAAAKTRTTALRMFLRFLITEGKCAATLEAAIPVLAHWRLSSLPRYLQPVEVDRLIASCNPTSPCGLRDRAISLLLARLGLRASDIVHLQQQDIDWKGSWIQVCGKGRLQTRLPLAQEVGQALVAYLKYGRPRTSCDAVFVRSRAPLRGFGSHCAVSMIVSQALSRAHVVRPSRGAAQLLRHSFATSMLRNGASLQDVADILRHRSIQTTQIYAKVDVTALRQIAQPWPEAQS
jgi:integrase/recombinase XerD